MTKRFASKHKVDRRLKANLWGRPKSPFNSRNYKPGQHGKSTRSKTATKSQVNKFLNFIINGLDKKGFLQPDHKRQSMIRNIYNIFYRSNLSEQEIRILLGVFSTLNVFNRKSWIDNRLPMFINHVV